MIIYERGGIHFVLGIFKRRGSVFPTALVIALPCALLTCIVKSLSHPGDVFDFVNGENSILKETATWSGFTFLVGFLIVFRTSQAYSRFWEGCYSTHMMRAEWFDACSSIVAFCKHSSASPELIKNFQELVIRLFSMLHAVALAEIEDVAAESRMEDVQAFKYDLIDIQSVDIASLEAVRESETKVELVFQWIQQSIVENINTGVLSIPPPILSRSFQELATGMVHFHDAIKLSNIPFPFPYAQTCDALLLFHWVLSPFVVSAWTARVHWAGIFSFVSVFILWSLNCIAVEIENPFGRDDNDIDAELMQAELNKHLSLLLTDQALKTPTIVKNQKQLKNRHNRRQSTFLDVWMALADKDKDAEAEEEEDEASETEEQEPAYTSQASSHLPADCVAIPFSAQLRKQKMEKQAGGIHRMGSDLSSPNGSSNLRALRSATSSATSSMFGFASRRTMSRDLGGTLHSLSDSDASTFKWSHGSSSSVPRARRLSQSSVSGAAAKALGQPRIGENLQRSRSNLETGPDKPRTDRKMGISKSTSFANIIEEQSIPEHSSIDVTSSNSPRSPRDVAFFSSQVTQEASRIPPLKSKTALPWASTRERDASSHPEPWIEKDEARS